MSERRKRTPSEKVGWTEGNVADFLGLTEEETRLIDLRVRLGQTIRRLRQARGLTQEALASLLKTGQARVARIELGLPGVKLDPMFRALFALGGDIGDLAGEARTPARSSSGAAKAHA
jgi:hypothetical protein